MQQMADTFVKNLGIVVAAALAAWAILSPIIGMFVGGLVKVGYLKADSRLAKIVAVLCNLTIHAKSSLVLLLVLAVPLTGCSMEAARQRRISNQADARASSPAARNLSTCQFFSGVKVGSDWTAGVSAGMATAAVGVAASTDGRVQDYATGFAVGLGAVSTAAVAISTQSAASWTEQCSQ